MTRLVSELAADDAIFTCDVGTPTVWAARYLKMNGKRRLIGSFNHGSMANAMLQAIGAQAAYPGRQVVSMSGDGGFTMMMGDFLSLAQLGLPVKVVVLNNGTLGFVELEMKASGFLDVGCELKNPNFAAMARGDRHQGRPGRAAAGAAGGADRRRSRHRRAGAGRRGQRPPGTRHAAQDRAWPRPGKFGLFLLKAVLDGRTNEVDRPRQGESHPLIADEQRR